MSAQSPDGQALVEELPPETDGGVRHILVIEDDVDLADLFVVWIQTHFGDRAEVHTAHTLEDGEAHLQTLHRVDLVLLDRKFPEGTGDELLDTITREFDAITIMITGVSPELDLIRLPITDYLVKPVDRETFVKRLSLLDKLRTAGVLAEYTNARKASLLEYHLDDPDEHPLFRRFAARWSYDRLEAIDTGEEVLIYELYLGRTDGPEREISISIVGTLEVELGRAVEAGSIRAVGELVPSGKSHAWLDVHERGPIDPADGGYVVYEFETENPERLISAEVESTAGAVRDIETRLETAYS